MSVIYGPLFYLLEFGPHLRPNPGPALSFCPLIFSEATMLGSSLRKSRKTFLGSGPSTCASVEPTAPDR